jgi:wyosine [tRNA(Phe)-imidazoG37] synthetase (radical SAM superfamily)
VIAFGPVPSRRLGRSLGINHLSGKVCSYSCVYCQVGRTNHLRIRRRDFRRPEDVLRNVSEKVEAAARRGESLDYLTFVPDGEPTLDRRLGAMIRMLRPLGLPIAVLTNGSLLDREDVREDLGEADWVSVKVDTVDRERWRTANRPHGALRLPSILDGMRAFADGFRRRLVTETMLLNGVNDGEAELRATASFIGALSPNRAYLAVPTRPPAESWVRPPSAVSLARASEVFRARTGRVELLAGYEGDAFAATGDPREDLLAIMAVHPMRQEAVARFLRRSGRSRRLIDEMVRRGELVRVVYGGHWYCLRPIPPTARSPAPEEWTESRRWSPSRRHWHPWI